MEENEKQSKRRRMKGETKEEIEAFYAKAEATMELVERMEEETERLPEKKDDWRWERPPRTYWEVEEDVPQWHAKKMPLII